MISQFLAEVLIFAINPLDLVYEGDQILIVLDKCEYHILTFRRYESHKILPPFFDGKRDVYIPFMGNISRYFYSSEELKERRRQRRKIFLMHMLSVQGERHLQFNVRTNKICFAMHDVLVLHVANETWKGIVIPTESIFDIIVGYEEITDYLERNISQQFYDDVISPFLQENGLSDD